MRVRIEYEIEIPEGFDEDEIVDYLRFSVGDKSGIPSDNKLEEIGISVEPVFGSFEWVEI